MSSVLPRESGSLKPLTRKEFYDLTATCRQYALDLARFDQHRVNLKECYRFNGWLAELRGYDRLAEPLHTLRPARPVARWQIMVIETVIWLILAAALPNYVSRNMATVILFSGTLLIVSNFFIPESLFGTTVELLQGKVLRIVNLLDDMLNNGAMGFSEAAFYQARANLQAAHDELRQQIDLAHRS
jgi:hypothetical protein